MDDDATMWDTLGDWLRHPLSMAASLITFTYCVRHNIELRLPDLKEGV